MGDVHISPPAPGAIGAKVDELMEAGHELYATVVSGHPQGRVRRPTLFLIAGVSIVLTYFLSCDYLAVIPAVVGLIAILLLALTDSVVEL